MENIDIHLNERQIAWMPMPLERLTPSVLKNLLQSLAALDAIISPDPIYRYYTFNSQWSSDELMGAIQNGSGDEVFILFNSVGCFLKGFSHEYQNDSVPSDAFYREVPSAFSTASREPAFSPEYVTYCYWQFFDGEGWKSCVSPDDIDPDAYFLIEELDGNPRTYLTFALEYYEVELDLETIDSIYRYEPVTKGMAQKLNPEIVYPDLVAELEEIGYPCAPKA